MRRRKPPVDRSLLADVGNVGDITTGFPARAIRRRRAMADDVELAQALGFLGRRQLGGVRVGGAGNRPAGALRLLPVAGDARASGAPPPVPAVMP